MSIMSLPGRGRVDTWIQIGTAESCSRRQSNRTACRCLSAAPIASGVPAKNENIPLLLSAKARICQDRLGTSASKKDSWEGRKEKGEGLRFAHRCVPAPAQTAPARSLAMRGRKSLREPCFLVLVYQAWIVLDKFEEYMLGVTLQHIYLRGDIGSCCRSIMHGTVLVEHHLCDIITILRKQ